MLQPSRPTTSPSGEARDQRTLLLAAAAQEFNARGIAGASIARIARSVGLTRAAVYYYVKDREELAALAYAQTCASMARDLENARKTKGAGLSRLLTFVRIALDSKRAPEAVLSELDFFEGRVRREIEEAHAANVASLRDIVRDGIADRSIRPCDDEIVAQTIIGTITWIPLSVDWVEGTDASYRGRTIDALCDVLTHGEAADPGFEFVPPIGIDAFFPQPPKAFDRKAESEAKIEHMLMIASRLFNRRGIDGTSLDDIMEAAGATKGALYHYLDNKTDLVVRCYRRAFTLYERFADASERLGRTGLERAMIGTYLNVQAHASELSPLIQMVGASTLPQRAKREITQRARALQRRFSAFGREGLRDGSFREIDFDAVAQLGAGAFEWLPKWFRADDPRRHSLLAQEITTLFIRGLRAR